MIRKPTPDFEVSVPIPPDENGYLDRACPSSACRVHFKVSADDWEPKANEEAVYCPLCRHEAEATDWNTDVQREHLMELAKAHVEKLLHTSFSKMARDFNSRQPARSLFKISMSIDRPQRRRILPLRASQIMEQRYTCEMCGCRYATIGASFFCPACGHNSIVQTFNDSLKIQRTMIQNEATLRRTLEEQLGKDASKTAWTHILETTFGKAVAVFEHYAETQFLRLPNLPKVKRGDFQRLDDASALWRQMGRKGYDDILSASDFNELHIFIQRRHLLTHRNGLVDADYRKRSGDATLEVGQRVNISQKDLLRLLTHIETIATSIAAGQ